MRCQHNVGQPQLQCRLPRFPGILSQYLKEKKEIGISRFSFRRSPSHVTVSTLSILHRKLQLFSDMHCREYMPS